MRGLRPHILRDAAEGKKECHTADKFLALGESALPLDPLPVPIN